MGQAHADVSSSHTRQESWQCVLAKQRYKIGTAVGSVLTNGRAAGLTIITV